MPRTALIACVVVAVGGLPAFGTSPLPFAERVSAQAAIEGVYWQHRTWPSDNPDSKPSLDQVLPESVLRARVEDYLLESQTLERLWARPILEEELQAEVERMAASSRAPEVLREIFAALKDDPTLVAECLARPLLADRLIRAAYAHDPRFHRAQRDAIEQSLFRHGSVEAAKSLGGAYGETVWTLGGRRPQQPRALAGGRVIPMDLESWSRNLTRLRAAFAPESAALPLTRSESTEARRDPRSQDLPVGVLSGLQENDESFFVQAVLEKNSDRLKVATVVWRKTPFDEWWARTKATLDLGSLPESAPTASGVQPLPTLVESGCTPDTWTAVQSIGAPSPREWLTAVWTGAEMIVWGGYNAAANMDTNTGGRYMPATDSWTATSTTGAPVARDTHTAVWTGTQMLIWGGTDASVVPLDTGGRYDPATNAWLATTTTGAPTARVTHTAVWSGSRMIVWGGYNANNNSLDTGGRYDPVANTWATTVKTGAPAARDGHTAVWAGTTMVVWGGEDDAAIPLDSGGRYDPIANTWSATTVTGAPAARMSHTAVWTGSRMVAWGGFDGTADLNTGGIYDPAGDTWTPTSTLGAPAARDHQFAAWMNPLPEMIVWGGQDDLVTPLNTGGRYNPTTDVWTTTSTVGAPIGRTFGTPGVWTDTEMIVWGGYNAVDLGSGGRYCSIGCGASATDGSSAISVGMPAGGDLVAWTSVAGATAYDLVRGALVQLHTSGGDFTASTQACLANDQVAASYTDANTPVAANGFWYLVRGVNCSGPGTYNAADPTQIGSRDAEINASANRCP